MMSRYSVAEAKNTLPSLLDKAMAGEEVVITRHGKPIAEIKPMAAQPARSRGDSYARLIAARKEGPSINITSVELLNALYDERDY
jgi:prevent-host-death family protein